MTSAQSMQPDRRTRHRAITFTVVGAACLFFVGCEAQEKLRQPIALHAPYDRPRLWAVVPFNNESGVSTVRTDRIADAFTEQAEQVHGLQAIPVNRVIMAMRRTGMKSVSNANDAMILMNALGVEGVIVGTITAYDGFPPFKLGAAIQLFTRDREETLAIDPLRETRAPTDRVSLGGMAPENRVSQTAGVFDATSHQVLLWLDEFARGRTEPGDPYGKNIYLVRMELYTQFVAYRLIHDLLANEQTGLAVKDDKDQPR